MSRSNGSLIIYVKMKGKENFHAYTMSLFYILQKHYLHRSCIFFNDLLQCIISGLYIGGTNVTLISQVRLCVVQFLTARN